MINIIVFLALYNFVVLIIFVSPADLYVNGISPTVWGLSQDFIGNTYVFALDANRQRIYR